MLYNESMAKLDDPEVLRELYIEQRLDTGDIAKQLEVGFNTVVRALAKFGIKKEHRFPKVFTPEQRSVLYGSMLGDANLSIQKNGTNACLRMEHSLKQEAWLRWKFKQFQPWINAEEPTLQMNKKNHKGSECSSIKFTTVATPLFTKVYEDFYTEGKKIVTKQVMDKIDALALATWYQDDGTCGSGKFRLATHGFSENEHIILGTYFEFKWKMKPRIVKEKYHDKEKIYFYLYFEKEDARKLVEIIRPYVIPSMQYKLDAKAKAGDFCQ